MPCCAALCWAVQLSVLLQLESQQLMHCTKHLHASTCMQAPAFSCVTADTADDRYVLVALGMVIIWSVHVNDHEADTGGVGESFPQPRLV